MKIIVSLIFWGVTAAASKEDAIIFSRNHDTIQRVRHVTSQGESGQALGVLEDEVETPAHRSPGSTKELRELENEIQRGAFSSSLRGGGQRVRQLSLASPKCGKGQSKKIVQCLSGVPEADCRRELQEAGFTIAAEMPRTLFFAVCVDEDDTSLEHLIRIQSIEDDPPRRPLEWEGSPRRLRDLREGQFTPYGIEIIQASTFWQTYDRRGEGVSICVVDTGVLTAHEDLTADAWDGSQQFINPWKEDAHGHGSHVAGIMVASDNDLGVVGVAPGADLYVVRVFDGEGKFFASDLIGSLQACADAGVNIINMSLGGPIATQAEEVLVKSLRKMGFLLIAAAGNTGDRNNLQEYPASYADVLSVGAVDSKSHIAAYSTYNSQVDIVGPGTDIVSLGRSSSTYMQRSGTSMAAPHISGVAALLRSQFPETSIDDIWDAMTLSAQDLGACGRDGVFGHGLIDIMAAAAFLEFGTAATELSDCVEVQISITTDDWGQETSFVITNADGDKEIVYRGGPYENGRRETYLSNIQLRDGCYEFSLLDRYGDGWNNAEDESGEAVLIYSGEEQVRINEFGGSHKTVGFGNCAGQNASHSAKVIVDSDPNEVTKDSDDAVTLPPAICGNGELEDEEECDDGNELDRDGCSAVCTIENITETTGCLVDESFLEVDLKTDQWSRAENSLYLYKVKGFELATIWAFDQFEFDANSEYEESACLDLKDAAFCYVFEFRDSWGDGLKQDGRLSLTLDGEEVLKILPGDKGTVDEDGKVMTIWTMSFGSCSVAASEIENPRR